VAAGTSNDKSSSQSRSLPSIAALGVAAARQEVPQAPQPPGREAQDDQDAVGTQHAIDLAEHRVRRGAALERVRQQHGVHGVAGHGELLRVADHVGGHAGPPVDQRPALGPGVAQEGVAGAPGADLQQLLAEDPF